MARSITTEGHLHVAARRYFVRTGWTLIAGQFPGGSDDELPPLNIVDPTVACDQSPDPRRHSDDKLVPDLVVLRDMHLVLFEMKPRYSAVDEQKLVTILTDRREDLYVALRTLGARRGLTAIISPEKLIISAGLSFRSTSSYPKRDDFAYLLVEALDSCAFIPPSAYPHMCNEDR